MNKTQYSLSIRQPWAWLIVNGFKDIENRSWFRNINDYVLIHASKALTKREYKDCVSFTHAIDKSIQIPSMESLERGGIVGEARITACVSTSDSPWFTGDYGFVIDNPMVLPFQECKGSLGFFYPDI